jgi:hypothetical protein
MMASIDRSCLKLRGAGKAIDDINSRCSRLIRAYFRAHIETHHRITAAYIDIDLRTPIVDPPALAKDALPNYGVELHLDSQRKRVARAPATV